MNEPDNMNNQPASDGRAAVQRARRVQPAAQGKRVAAQGERKGQTSALGGQTAAPSERGARAATWGMRVAFALVFAANMQCAVSFILWPDAYVPAYELSGAPGAAAVQGLGVAFLMWNVTYPAAIARPQRFRSLAVVVLVQQMVGLVGESWVRATLPAGHTLLAANIERFIAFDAFGLVIMAVAFAWLLWAERRSSRR